MTPNLFSPASFIKSPFHPCFLLTSLRLLAFSVSKFTQTYQALRNSAPVSLSLRTADVTIRDPEETIETKSITARTRDLKTPDFADSTESEICRQKTFRRTPSGCSTYAPARVSFQHHPSDSISIDWRPEPATTRVTLRLESRPRCFVVILLTFPELESFLHPCRRHLPSFSFPLPLSMRKKGSEGSNGATRLYFKP